MWFRLFSWHHIGLVAANLVHGFMVSWSPHRYLLLQLFFNIVPLNGDLTISLESLVELISDVPFHAVFCTNITDAADMGPGSATVHVRTKWHKM